jgi:protein-disulfide isomerase
MTDQSGERYQDFQTDAMTDCSGQLCKACTEQQDHMMKHLYLLTMSCSHSTTLVLTSSYKCSHCSATSTASVQPLITNGPSASSAADQVEEMADQSGDRYQGYHTGAMAGCSGRPCRACRQQQDHTMEHLCLLTMPYNHTTTLVLTSSYKCPRCFATASGSIQVKGVKHVH